VKISIIDLALKKYSEDRGFFRKFSKTGRVDQSDIVKLRNFRNSLANKNPDRDLTTDELSTLSMIIRNKKTKRGHLSHKILLSLDELLAPSDQVYRPPLTVTPTMNLPGMPTITPAKSSPDFTELPRDIRIMLFRYLNRKSFFSLSRVNRTFFNDSKNTVIFDLRQRFLSENQQEKIRLEELRLISIARAAREAEARAETQAAMRRLEGLRAADWLEYQATGLPPLRLRRPDQFRP